MQKKIPITRLILEQVKILNKKATYAILCGAKSFSLYDKPNIREFLNLLQPAYTVPYQKAIGDKFLIECYNETYTEVLKNIRGNDFINVFTDKSFISTRQRVINYCIFVKAESFCMK